MQINSKFASPNFQPRQKNIEYIILHYTDLAFDESLKRLCAPEFQVSSHYLIREDGEIYRLVNDSEVAWHAGVSNWGKSEKLNQNSIGIEINNLGNTPFPDKQIEACIKLVKYLVNNYNLHPHNILGHSDIAPERKIDPGIFFPWSRLAAENLGLWHGLELNSAENLELIFQYGQENIEISNLQEKLASIGYNVKVTGKFDDQTNYVIRAFQAHFFPNTIFNQGGIAFFQDENSHYHWDNHSQQILDFLLAKYMKNC